MSALHNSRPVGRDAPDRSKRHAETESHPRSKANQKNRGSEAPPVGLWLTRKRASLYLNTVQLVDAARDAAAISRVTKSIMGYECDRWLYCDHGGIRIEFELTLPLSPYDLEEQVKQLIHVIGQLDHLLAQRQLAVEQSSHPVDAMAESDRAIAALGYPALPHAVASIARSVPRPLVFDAGNGGYQKLTVPAKTCFASASTHQTDSDSESELVDQCGISIEIVSTGGIPYEVAADKVDTAIRAGTTARLSNPRNAGGNIYTARDIQLVPRRKSEDEP